VREWSIPGSLSAPLTTFAPTTRSPDNIGQRRNAWTLNASGEARRFIDLVVSVTCVLAQKRRKNMALITTGLTNGGVTAHYKFSYDASFANSAANPNGPEPARTNAVIAACENDYNLMSSWFGGGVNVTGMSVQVTANNGIGASWNGSAGSSTIQLNDAQGQSYRLDPVYLRYLIIVEAVEIFMMAQNIGWFDSAHGNEGSKGEGMSRFLGSQFLAQNGSLGLGIDASFAVAKLWLNSPRNDFVNNAPDDTGYDATNGCTTLFIYYLFHQLGFSIKQIVAAGASTLAGVYKHLTGDPTDPFPFFKLLLDTAFPSHTSSAVPGPNFDDPWPLAMLTFVVAKGAFRADEVTDAVTAPNNGIFPQALWLQLDGFNQQVLGGSTPTLSGPALGLTGVTMPANAAGAQYQNPANMLAPQRVLFPIDVDFTPAALAIFPAAGTPALDQLLDGSITVLGKVFTTATHIELMAGTNPYFTNIDSSQNNVSWLSQDLRLFTATPSQNSSPVPGAPPFAADTLAGAYAYIQTLLTYLNANYTDPAGTDPFNAANNVVPDQAGAYTGDSSVTPSTNSAANYNFAIARVRLRGAQGAAGTAQNVRVFFRLWSTQTADTDFQPATYPSHTNANGRPDWPLAAPGHTLPFFATSNAPVLSAPNNPEYGANGVNNQTIVINSGDGAWHYFGCFLNVYDPSNVINGSQIQTLLNGTHHCLVAEIAYDGAPIINSNGVTESPDNCDRLAQRNLQVTLSDNPGVPATHIIPQTFDIRPSPTIILGKDILLQYPDELMIDWGNTPPGSTASIYWPQVNAFQVLHLESKLYGSHVLSAADANTIRCDVTRGITYVPIPSGTGQNFAGLLTIDLPPTVVRGQEFNIVIRRVATRRVQEEPTPRIELTAKPTPRNRARHNKRDVNWRYVTGTFQVRIPVSTHDAILSAEENTIAIFKWRLNAMSPENRWYPVLQRYISLISARVAGLGGDPDAIPPSLRGAPDGREASCEHLIEYKGKVKEVIYDCFGDVEGFVLSDCCGARVFKTREREIGKIAVQACQGGLELTVYVQIGHEQKIRKLALGR
jgi:hypothetical protein